MPHVVCNCLTLFPHFSTTPLSPSLELSSYNPGKMQIEHPEDASEGVMTPEHRGQLRRLAKVRLLQHMKLGLRRF
jgi:hypothetical protein